MTEEKLTVWQEIKKYWIIFLLFGIISAGISAGVSTYISSKVSENMQGPPCRIDFSKEEFPMVNSSLFSLQYLLINLRDKDLLIEGIDSYCVWQTKQETESKNDNVIIEQPITKEIPAPRELDKFLASKSAVMNAQCKSPDQEGTYKIRIIARTTSGSCQGDILMKVVLK